MVTVRELPSPFLIVDLDAVDRNIERMQRYCDEHALTLRPHVKTHKLPLLAHFQLAAGARGIACQKLCEAEVMAAAGIDDILITFPLVGAEKAERFATLAAKARVSVGADSDVVARGLSAALAEHVAALPGLELEGLMTHPGVAASSPWLRGARHLIEQRGLTVRRVSGGGTAGAFHLHEGGVFTELRAGTYVYGDRRLAALGLMALEDCALRVVAAVVSRPTDGRAILDAGSKTLTSDFSPGLDDGAYGLVVEYPDAILTRLSEEHGTLDLTGCDHRPAIGERVTIVPNHCCGAVNLHDEVALHHGGERVEIVPIPARGRVR